MRGAKDADQRVALANLLAGIAYGCFLFIQDETDTPAEKSNPQEFFKVKP